MSREISEEELIERKRKRKEYNLKYREKNLERLLEKDRLYAKNNKERISERRKKDYQNNKEKYQQRNREYRLKHLEERRERDRKYHHKNKEKRSLKAKIYRENNKEKINENRREKYNNNKKNIRERVLNERRSFLGKIKETYITMTKRSKEKFFDNIIPKEDFIKFASEDVAYNNYYKQWVVSGFQRNLSPSIDRIDNSKGYISGNLQFLTFVENASKGNKDVPCRHREIILTNETTNEVKTFNSFRAMKECSLFLNVTKSIIRSNIFKKNKTPVNGWYINYGKILNKSYKGDDV